ncbi:MAG: TonB-dependent receptor [Ignavibacteria bacterium]|nr:TonB-dependent receptor [Ignavibacteria bacterium]
MKKYASITAIAITCSFQFLHAQSPDTTIRTILKEGIVVQAVRAGKDAPFTNSTVDSVAVRNIMSGQDAEYIIEQVSPSVVAYSESGTNFSNYGSFRLRGIDQTRINVTWNGVPLNDMIDQGVFFSNLTDLMNGVHSVQVQRGVGTSSNGTASIGGSVNIESADLNGLRPSTRIQLTGGSFNLRRGSAEVSTGRLPGNFSSYARFSTFSTDGYRYSTASSSWSASIGTAWYSSDDIIKFSAVAGRTANQLGYFAVPKPIYDADRRTNINDSSDNDNFGQYVFQVQWNHSISAKAVSNVQIYYGGAGGDFFSGFRDTAGVLTQINYPLSNQHLGTILSVNVIDVVDSLDITAGLHAYMFKRRNWETVSPEIARPYYDDRTQKNEVSGFLKGQWNAGRISLFGDVQLRSVAMNFYPDVTPLSSKPEVPQHNWFFFNPKFGVTYEASNNVRLFASYGLTGREPTRFDLLGSTQISDANVNVLLKPNTVRPEYVADLEGGIRYADEIFDADINFFYMSFTDEIAPIGQYIDQQFVQLRKNMPSSRRIGAEIEARIHLSERINISVSGTFMNATISEYSPENIGADTTYTSVTPVLTPKIIAFAGVTFLPYEKLELEANTRYVGQSFLELTNRQDLQLDAFITLNARAKWTFGHRHSIGVLVNNILNKEYVTNGATAFYNGTLVPTLFAQAGINFTVMFELALGD